MSGINMVLVVDDDPAVRDALTLLLGSVGLEVRPFESGTDFLERWDGDTRCCLLLDVRMPGISGLDLQAQLRAEGRCPPTVFITGHGDVDLAVRAMRGGALDFVEKPFRDQDLIDRVQAALAAAAASWAAAEHHHAFADRLATLTPRESEVLDRLVEGQANKVIALELGLSERTVEVHRAHVMEKTGARNLADLVRDVTQHRLLFDARE